MKMDIVFAGLWCALVIITLFIAKNKGYEVGQQDALRGKQKYRLEISYKKVFIRDNKTSVLAIDTIDINSDTYEYVWWYNSKGKSYTKTIFLNDSIVVQTKIELKDTTYYIYIPIDTTFIKIK